MHRGRLGELVENVTSSPACRRSWQPSNAGSSISPPSHIADNYTEWKYDWEQNISRPRRISSSPTLSSRCGSFWKDSPPEHQTGTGDHLRHRDDQQSRLSFREGHRKKTGLPQFVMGIGIPPRSKISCSSWKAHPEGVSVIFSSPSAPRAGPVQPLHHLSDDGRTAVGLEDNLSSGTIGEEQRGAGGQDHPHRRELGLEPATPTEAESWA